METMTLNRGLCQDYNSLITREGLGFMGFESWPKKRHKDLTLNGDLYHDPPSTLV